MNLVTQLQLAQISEFPKFAWQLYDKICESVSPVNRPDVDDFAKATITQANHITAAKMLVKTTGYYLNIIEDDTQNTARISSPNKEIYYQISHSVNIELAILTALALKLENEAMGCVGAEVNNDQRERPE